MNLSSKNRGIIKQHSLMDLLNKKVDLKKQLITLKKNKQEEELQEELIEAIAEIDNFLSRHRIQK
tara:strand:+ start:9519 stop:9713 length:195 start_codon:yes stop_codon:yes gene_type:complete